MELDHLEAFVAIARRGGFTRASASLHLSQPAISRRVHLLERELGGPLFERLASGVVPTDLGRAFLPHAERVLAALQDGVAAARAVAGGESGPLTLALVGTLASSPLTAVLRRFREARPGVDLRLRTALSTEVSDLVRRGDATLGLRYGLDRRAELRASKLYDEPMLPVCAAAHPLARRRPSGAALAAERWITFPPPAGGGREPYSAAIERGLAGCGVDAPSWLFIDSLTAQKRMVEAGFGLAVLQASSVDEELRAGVLRRLDLPGLRVTTPVVLVERRDGYLSGAARALIGALRAEAARLAPAAAAGRGARRQS